MSSEGARLAAEGIEQAVSKADRDLPAWSEQAFQAARLFLIEKTPLDRFQIEDIRAEATKKGLPEPPSLRAWGSVARRLRNAGLIEHVGFEPVSNAQAHCAPCAVYRVGPGAWDFNASAILRGHLGGAQA